jgi:hypothetical protein
MATKHDDTDAPFPAITDPVRYYRTNDDLPADALQLPAVLNVRPYQSKA